MSESPTCETAPDPIIDWTVDPESGRSNSSPEFLAIVAEVERLMQSGAGACLSQRWIAMTAKLIVAQLAHVHRMSPEAANVRCCVCWLTGEGDASPVAMVVNGLSVCWDHAPYCQGSELGSVLRRLREEQQKREVAQ